MHEVCLTDTNNVEDMEHGKAIYHARPLVGPVLIRPAYRNSKRRRMRPQQVLRKRKRRSLLLNCEFREVCLCHGVFAADLSLAFLRHQPGHSHWQFMARCFRLVQPVGVLLDRFLPEAITVYIARHKILTTRRSQ